MKVAFCLFPMRMEFIRVAFSAAHLEANKDIVVACWERTSLGANSDVTAAGCNELKRAVTDGYVVIAGRVARERIKTDGRIADAGCVLTQCTFAVSCI